MPDRYVPPHLRGRGGSSNNNSSNNRNNNNSSNSNSARRNTSTQSTAGSSRWKNLDSGGNNDHRYNGRNDSDYDGNNKSSNNNRRSGSSNFSASTGNTGNGKSRWANVDRSSIEAKGHSNSRYGNNNNNNYNYDNRRFHDNRRNNNNKLEHVKAIFFGDSFIKLFGLLNDYSDSVLKGPRTIEVQKYKAASAKGVCREGNENRSKILRTVERIRNNNINSNDNNNDKNNNSNSAYQNLERLVFCFGSVDVHMSFYFKKYVQRQPLSDDDLRTIAIDYVDFVASLETITATATDRDTASNTKPLTKLIVGIYPSPLCDKDVGASLLAYGSLETEEQVAAVDASDDKLIEQRQARVDLFNKALSERCDFYNQDKNNNNNGILEYWDVQSDLLILDERTERPRVRDDYKDVSDLNIHLIHETTLQLWVQKWPWYEALTTATTGSNENETHSHNSTSFLEYLQKTFDEYRKTKPWAERTHVAETRGIQLSL